jgi:hypothetical protein
MLSRTVLCPAKIQRQMRAEGIAPPALCILQDGKLKEVVFQVLDTNARFNCRPNSDS